MKCSLSRFAFPLGLSILFSCPSFAQQVINYGRTPNPSVLAIPDATTQQYTFSPQNGFACPTPSVSFGGYGAGGNDWSNDFTANSSAGTGVNNFGIAAGIRVPLSGESARHCKAYSRSLLKRAEIETEAALRNDQLVLLTQCHWLRENRINIRQNIFMDKDGALSSLNPCNDYSTRPLAGADGPEVSETPLPKSHSLSPPLSPEPSRRPQVDFYQVNPQPR